MFPFESSNHHVRVSGEFGQIGGPSRQESLEQGFPDFMVDDPIALFALLDNVHNF